VRSYCSIIMAIVCVTVDGWILNFRLPISQAFVFVHSGCIGSIHRQCEGRTRVSGLKRSCPRFKTGYPEAKLSMRLQYNATIRNKRNIDHIPSPNSLAC
jgi:hypothetical protein